MQLVEIPKAEIKNVDPVETFWLNLIEKDPDKWKNTFKRLAKTNWKRILYSKNLSPLQKFEKIFDVKASEIQSNLLGAWEWLENLFSEKNLNNVEKWVRTGEKVSQSLANAVNLLKNQPNISNQVQREIELKNLESQAFLQSQSFLDTYSTPIIFGAAALVLFLIMKK
jgi:hypothetical protein